MKFIPRFDLPRRLVWLALLVAAFLLVSGPLQGKEPLVPPSITGNITVIKGVGNVTAIDAIKQIIEIDGTRYTLANQSEIYKETGSGLQRVRIIDLKFGQSVEFLFSGDVITNIRILE